LYDSPDAQTIHAIIFYVPVEQCQSFEALHGQLLACAWAAALRPQIKERQRQGGSKMDMQSNPLVKTMLTLSHNTNTLGSGILPSTRC